jgi:hypothetical protein
MPDKHSYAVSADTPLLGEITTDALFAPDGLAPDGLDEVVRRVKEAATGLVNEIPADATVEQRNKALVSIADQVEQTKIAIFKVLAAPPHARLHRLMERHQKEFFAERRRRLHDSMERSRSEGISEESAIAEAFEGEPWYKERLLALISANKAARDNPKSEEPIIEFVAMLLGILFGMYLSDEKGQSFDALSEIDRQIVCISIDGLIDEADNGDQMAADDLAGYALYFMKDAPFRLRHYVWKRLGGGGAELKQRSAVPAPRDPSVIRVVEMIMSDFDMGVRRACSIVSKALGRLNYPMTEEAVRQVWRRRARWTRRR